MVEPFKIDSHLDIGCSMGELLKKIGARVSIGVDPDPKWTKEVTALYRTIDEVQGRFDLITLIQVLEHLNKPQEMMQKVKERLSPGGVVLIEVPNRRAYMTAYNSPQHVVAYDMKSLARLVVYAGLEVVDIALHDYLHNGPLDLYLSVFATNNMDLCKLRVDKNKIGG
jgi:SAM-dependent methyltransferase